jgi:hypothetical protein
LAQSIKSGRGIYHLKSAAAPERADNSWTLTIALERADGIEKIVLRCRVPVPPRTNASETAAVADLLDRIAPAIERDFEHLREETLKSIRTEHRLFEFALED